MIHTPTPAECRMLIEAVEDPAVNVYSVACPNNQLVTHYVRYDCNGLAGIKYEPDCTNACSDPTRTAATCEAYDLIEVSEACDGSGSNNSRHAFLRRILRA